MKALAAGGRLFYQGAGTSGRLAVLDAAELIPTFSAPPGLVIGLLAGGPEAMTFMADLAAKAHARGTPFLITRRRTRKDPVQQAQEPWLPVHNCKTAWQRAMAGIALKFGRKWRWHDLRAAYITYVAMTSGAMAAQKLARHSDFATTQRYIEVADEITRAAANRAAARPLLAVIGGKSK